MPCNLVILGKTLDIDAFLSKSKLRGCFKHYKGEPKFKSKPLGEKLPYSSLVTQTSKASFDNLEKQIADTIKYLKRHKSKLSLIKTTKEVENALLDFGVALRINKKQPAQFDRYPNSLLSLASELGLDLHISLYSIDK